MMVDDSDSDVCSELVKEAVRMQRHEMELEERKKAAVAATATSRQSGPCNWSKKDEVALLQVLVEFKKKGGNVFKISASWLEEAVKGKLDGHFTQKQLQRKVRGARDNFKRKSKPSSARVHELSSQLWGTHTTTTTTPTTTNNNAFSPDSIIQLHSLLMLQAAQSFDDSIITQLYKGLNSTARDELEQQGRQIQRRMHSLRNACTQFHNQLLSLCFQSKPTN